MSTNILGLKPDRLLNALAAEQEEEIIRAKGACVVNMNARPIVTCAQCGRQTREPTPQGLCAMCASGLPYGTGRDHFPRQRPKPDRR